MLNYIIKHATYEKLGGNWRTQCLSTIFSLRTMLCGKNVKLYFFKRLSDNYFLSKRSLCLDILLKQVYTTNFDKLN